MELLWQHLEHGHGHLHLAGTGRDLPLARADFLIVFVHGILSKAASWEKAPEELIEHIKLDVNVLNFQYPVGPFDRASYEEAASDLLITIDTYFANVDHIIFICHSAGGLVVKHAILRLWKEAGGRIDFNNDEPLVSSKVIRIRNIFNIAVPHMGGLAGPTYFGWVLSWFAGLIGQLLYPFHLIGVHAKINALKRSNVPGRNKIVPGLRSRNPELLGLEKDYLTIVRDLDEYGYPRPVALDYMAAADEVVPEYKAAEGFNVLEVDENFLYRSDAALLRVRGNHMSARGTHTSIRNDVIYAHVFSKIARFCEVSTVASPTTLQTRRVIAKAAIDWCHYLDTEKGIQHLYDDAKNPLKRHEDGRYVGCQRAIFGKISADTMSGLLSKKMVLLTGAGGTGKSAVLRCLVRRFANRWYHQKNPDGPVAFGVPLQQFSLTPEQRATLADDRPIAERKAMFMESLAVWTNDVLKDLPTLISAATGRPLEGIPETLSIDDLASLFSEGPLVFVLDSIDEFMGNAGLGDAETRNLIKAIGDLAKANPLFSVIVGARSGSAAARMALDLGAQCYEVAPLSLAAAESRYPDYGMLLKKAENREAKKFLLTPQIVARLGPVSASVTDERLARPRISEIAFDTFLDADDQAVKNHGKETCKDALAMLAWVAMVDTKSLGSASVTIQTAGLSDQLQRLHEERWSSSSTWSLPGPIAVRITQCFALLASEADLSALLHHSVFVSVGVDTFRFDHQEWLDYATARYLSIAMMAGNMRELGWRTFSPTIFRHLGWQLKDTLVTDYMLKSVLGATKGTGNQFIVGNFAASLGYWRPDFDSDDIVGQLLEFAGSAEDSRMRHAQHVLLTALGLLALQQKEGLIGVKVKESYGRMLDREPSLNPVTKSLVWCYWRAVNGADANGTGKMPWPRLDLSDGCLDDGIFLARPDAADKHRASVLARSIQYGYAETARLMLSDPARVIGAIHYLYPAAAAVRSAKSFSDVRLSLGEFLGQQESDDPIPSTSALLDALRGKSASEAAQEFCRGISPEPARQLADVLEACIELCRKGGCMTSTPSAGTTQ